MARCSECKKSLVEDTKEISWQSLFNFIHCLLLEEQITEATFNHMIDCLMDFKNYAHDWDKDYREFLKNKHSKKK